jgi:3-dehydroquinate synthetase
MEHINIYSGKKAISRIVTSDSIKGLGACLEPFRSVFAVIDKNIPVNAQLMEMLKAKNAGIRYINPSEETKTIETVMDICSWLLESGADRDAMILAVGGGITTDMAGFAACIYKRGVRFAYVPTTLLSQVDAAIGGKTGVNFEKYKNILGIIRQPAFTYICPQLLESLPKRDFLSGAAELLKTFIIEDNGNYQKASDLFFDIQSEFHLEVMMYGKDEKTQWRELLKKHRKTLTALIAAAANIKAGVVSRDQFEKGERRKLNLGHTFAHAIETLAQNESSTLPAEEQHFPSGVTHGEAVAMGLVLAARLADRYYRNDSNETTALEAKISNDLWDCDIPCYCPYSIEEMAETMKKDKKAEGSVIHFVLPKSIGEVETVELTVEEVCRLMK